MSILNSLAKELLVIRTEIQSSKPTPRTKALEKLSYIFDNRCEEIVRLLSLAYIEAETSWTQLFETLNDALQQQTINLEASKGTAGFKTIDNKSNEHINVFQKCINLANRERQNISYRDILDSAFECFKERQMSKYFDLCYLQVVKKNVLQYSKGNLAEIKIKDWCRKFLI